jgi:hypothetical protein
MRTPTKTLFATLAAGLALALAVNYASARNFGLSFELFRMVWSEPNGTPMIIQLGTEAASPKVSCPVTLEGSFHRSTIAKTLNLLVGYITRGLIGEALTCRGGTATIATETLPWHVQYMTFEGTLPMITRVYVLVIGLEMSAQVTGSSPCTVISETNTPARLGLFRGTGGVIEPAAWNTTIRMGNFCLFGFAASPNGLATVRQLGSTTTKITLTLLQ